MNTRHVLILPVLALGILLCTSGCIRTDNRIEVAPIEVKPIHITADINVNVRVDRSLDEFFSYQAPPTTTPAVPVPTPTTIPSR